MSTSENIRCTRIWPLVVVTLLAAAFTGSPAALAQRQHEGVMRLTDWPPETERRDLNHEVLPFIDTLFVSYSYDTSADQPSLSLAVEWAASGEAVIRRALRRLDEVDGRVRMVALELEAGVFVDDVRAATFTVVVDSMVTGPSPDFVRINLPDLSWSNIFKDVPEEEARSIFTQGFELREPEIVHVAFAYYTTGGPGSTGEVRPRIGRPDRARDVAVYPSDAVVDVVFDLFWLVGGEGFVQASNGGAPRGTAGRGSLDDAPRSRSAGAGDDRSARGKASERGDRDGRQTADRNGPEDDDRSRDKGGGRGDLLGVVTGDEDEDEDDDDDLVPYAVAAVGAAGLLAVAGGTIGYFGHSRYAPYGITSGLVRRDGGLLIQVAANEALLSDAESPKRLAAKLLAFGRLLNGSVQPALSGGILATSTGSNIRTEPSMAVGAVAGRGALLFYGGYDLFQHGVEFSAALNIRRLGLWGSRDSD